MQPSYVSFVNDNRYYAMYNIVGVSWLTRSDYPDFPDSQSVTVR